MDALAASVAETPPISSDLAAIKAIPDRFFNRELSWLTFNQRVLEEARRMEYPLLERLRFLSISGNNLDEFLMVRVAGLAGQVRRHIAEVSIDGLTPPRQLAAIRDEVMRLEAMQQEIWLELREALEGEGIHVVGDRGGRSLDPVQSRWLKDYFLDRILPVITPQAIDPAHPFPFVTNGGMGVMMSLTRIADGAQVMEMVLIPAALPRYVRIPGDDEAAYVSIADVIWLNAESLFPGFQVLGHGVFRVLRDSDIEIEEDAEDLVRYFRTAIQRRRRGSVIMLQLQGDFLPEAEQLLRDQLRLDHAIIIRSHGPIDMAGLSAIVDEKRPELKFAPYSPRYPERILEHDGDIFSAIREKDLVVHHPYESFEVVIDFLRQAAADPEVVAIKQTLYRAGKQSSIINALCAAAEAGKSVTAVVELKARFDEEQNLHWASQLENAGVQVIYGFVDWKTHAKISMVVRSEKDSDGAQVYRTYCHFGTGNYHPITARIYTDLSYFTADQAIGRDANQIFNFITGYVEPRRTALLAVAPVSLRERLYGSIEREIANARAGKPAQIWGKLNSLTDSQLIDRLYEASCAGVEVRLVVRGICCLRPGIPGLSENITVKSIIGRFLEHTRVWAFAGGAALPNPRARVFISSADGMSRNLDRRVEVLVPIRNKTVHDQVLDQVMMANLLDSEQSWLLGADGHYTRAELGEQPFNAHRYFMTNPSLSGRGASLGSGRKVPKLALRRGRA
ncbi:MULTISPECIES: RNA degradosome polyphosphate kinase [unclassified Novosphingobium]|uniref:RNA degradosome polyphosphate kinase n=1 Tax=unclassified Novosphingobium TaxID=2644732 RepID=UPI00086ACCAA|nr:MULTISPECIES: RNA degradosome polyphosphate kinase [unclassified Novosphingobium]MBN9145196.1 RNA degradosome polyphosphate kinase [Novosphingobium sp.]MDR6709573.1 polyphosphate kinase [Novosphingobium sp. 1748]NKI99104.1 polyphosphate kinase [Novosphingobium sp. SG707]ODU78232.1 MAG: RNA degradosome polyphosphate kinase [Novosphingobium sp. SCN 63-17]OJX88651.1 MAG: RNA degradosome polyphosphate kinase [Novosphingobium sp. 63-713]